jgi:hypothetical protein
MSENTTEKCVIQKYIQVHIHIYTRVYQNSWVVLGIPLDLPIMIGKYENIFVA